MYPPPCMTTQPRRFRRGCFCIERGAPQGSPRPALPRLCRAIGAPSQGLGHGIHRAMHETIAERLGVTPSEGPYSVCSRRRRRRAPA
jgi:hypothetical protein